MSEYRIGRHRGSFVAVWYEAGRRFRAALGTDDPALARTRLGEFARQRERLSRPERFTVAALYEAYRQDREADGADHRRIADAWKALAPAFGHMLPSHVTKQAVQAYTAARAAGGRSAGTVHTELGYLRAALRFAKREGLIADVPDVRLPAKPRPRDRYLTRAEAARLLEAAVLPHIRLFIAIALNTGARRGAILGLAWGRVDLARRRIHFADPDLRDTPKRRATVPINDTLLPLLKEAKKGALTTHVIEWGGRPVASVKRAFAEACRAAGLDGVSPHVLRHTAAVWMAEKRVPMPEIAQMLGHLDSRTTERVYARFSPDYLMRAAKALDG